MQHFNSIIFYDFLNNSAGILSLPLALGYPGGANSKEPTCLCRRHKTHGFDSWVGKILWEGMGATPIFLPEESIDRGAWPATVHRVTKSQTLEQLSAHIHAAAASKSLQSCLTLCDPMDGSPPGSPVPGILQARTLEWVTISFSNAWKWKVKVKSLSHVWSLATPWTAAYQVPLSMGFSRQEYQSVLLLPSPTHTYTHIYTHTKLCHVKIKTNLQSSFHSHAFYFFIMPNCPG